MNTSGFYACCGAIIAVMIASGTTPAHAADGVRTLTLAEYVQITLEHSPDAARILADSRRREADAAETGQLGNPAIQLDATALRQNSGQQLDLEVEQPLRGSDFGARRAHANAIRAVKNTEEKAQLLDLSHEAARAYLDLWQAQANMDLFDNVIRDAGRQAKTITNAAAQGIADRSEADIFTTEAAEMTLKKAALAAQRQTFMNALVRLAGLPSTDYRLEKPKAASLPSDAATVLQLADSETSVRAILKGRKGVAERRLAVAHADAALPEISPRAVMSRDFSNNSSAFMLGIHYTLPIWSQNQAEVMRAEADVQSTDAALRALDENSFPSVLQTAWRAARDNAEVAAKYESSIIPSWRKIQALTEKKSGMGQATAFDLWQVRNRFLETQIRALEAQRTALESVLTLENLSGVSFVSAPVKGN